MRLLITRPRYDTPTHYLYYWSKNILDQARRRNCDITDLEKDKANKGRVESYLKKLQPEIVIFNGHGNSSEVCGHDGETLIAEGMNEKLLAGSIVYVRACDSGKVLGPKAVAGGARGFVGYSENYMFPIDREKIGKPLEDELAGPILECSNQVAISLIKGKSITDAHADGLTAHKNAIAGILNSSSDKSFLIPFLQWNMAFQVCYK